MSHYLYIIHSASADRYYVGESQDPTVRLRQHNEHSFAGAATAMATDWHLVAIFACDDRAHARAMEKWVKSQKSTAVIKRLVEEEQFRDYQVRRFRKPPAG